MSGPRTKGSDMDKSFKIALTAFLITAGVIKGAPALAAQPIENVSIVRTADLDLTRKAGRIALDQLAVFLDALLFVAVQQERETADAIAFALGDA